jgi:hypothetical protein
MPNTFSAAFQLSMLGFATLSPTYEAMNTMKAFWNEFGRGPEPDAPVEVTLIQAQNTWSDGSGAKGNFFGLIDAEERTIQFYFEEGIPDHVEDATRLKIVLLDFPVPEKSGSYSRLVTIGEVHGLIAQAFAVGANPSLFENLTFSSW